MTTANFPTHLLHPVSPCSGAVVEHRLRRIHSTMARGLASRLSRRTCSGVHTITPPSLRNRILERWYAGPWPALQSLLFLAAVVLSSHPTSRLCNLPSCSSVLPSTSSAIAKTGSAYTLCCYHHERVFGTPQLLACLPCRPWLFRHNKQSHPGLPGLVAPSTGADVRRASCA